MCLQALSRARLVRHCLWAIAGFLADSARRRQRYVSLNPTIGYTAAGYPVHQQLAELNFTLGRSHYAGCRVGFLKLVDGPLKHRLARHTLVQVQGPFRFAALGLASLMAFTSNCRPRCRSEDAGPPTRPPSPGNSGSGSSRRAAKQEQRKRGRPRTSTRQQHGQNDTLRYTAARPLQWPRTPIDQQRYGGELG